VGCECRRHQGLHIFEDHFYPEIVDPATGEPLPEGTEGELVLTTLSKQAMPMIRYRTRDITMIFAGQMRVRAYAAEDWAHRPAQRRYADYSRRQCISIAGRVRAAGD